MRLTGMALEPSAYMVCFLEWVVLLSPSYRFVH